MKSLIQLALVFALSLSAVAHAAESGKIMIGDGWARVIMQSRPAAGYMTVHNMTDQAARIVAASSPMAERVELHTHMRDGDVMKMRPVDTVDVPAKGTVAFEPGGLHLMIFGLKQPLKKGDVLPVTVTFEKSDPIDIELLVGTGSGGIERKDHSGN